MTVLEVGPHQVQFALKKKGSRTASRYNSRSTSTSAAFTAVTGLGVGLGVAVRLLIEVILLQGQRYDGFGRGVLGAGGTRATHSTSKGSRGARRWLCSVLYCTVTAQDKLLF